MINIYNPVIKNYTNSVFNAIESGWISNHGEYVQKSTKLIQSYFNIKHAILMCNGTCATHCLFIALKFAHPNVKTIYVPNNSYVAAYNALLMEYDIENIKVMNMDVNTFNICTDESYILSLDKDAAVLIVHNVGNIINVPRLKRLRPDLIFIEDNCEGFLGQYEDKYTGSTNDTLCSSVSFYGNKIITTGEGGAFFTNNTTVYEHINKIYCQGMSKIRYLHDVHAYNYRMTNVQAALLYDQLLDCKNILENKKDIFKRYNDMLSDLIKSNKVKIFDLEANTSLAPWIYSLRIINNNINIEESISFFKNNNVEIRPFFYPINCHLHLSSIIVNEEEISHTLNKEIIMIPSSPNITFAEQLQVINTLRKFILYNMEINTIEVDKNNINKLEKFVNTIDSSYFRYFNSRTIGVVSNHIVTILLEDIKTLNIIGYAHIDFDEKYWLGLYIDSKFRNRSIGSILLNYLLNHDIIHKLKIENIHLTVDKDNFVAISLYEKFGFTIQEISNNVIHMMKKL